MHMYIYTPTPASVGVQSASDPRHCGITRAADFLQTCIQKIHFYASITYEDAYRLARTQDV